MAAERYQHSGRFTPQAFLFMPFLAVAMLAPALLYGVATIYSPCIGITTVLAVVGYAFAAGMMGGHALRYAHTRNRLVAMVLSAFIGLAALWAAWVAFLGVMVAKAGADVPLWAVFLPSVDAAMIGSLDDHGWFTLKGMTPDGGILALIWLVEAVGIVGFSAYTAFNLVDSPYCESCQKWTTRRALPGAIASGAGMVNAVDLANAEAIGRVPAAPAGATIFERLSVQTCPTCTRMRTLSLSTVRQSTDSKGRTSESITVLVPHVLVDEAFVERVCTARST